MMNGSASPRACIKSLTPTLNHCHQPITRASGRAWNTNQQLPIFLNHTRSATGYGIAVRKMFYHSYLYVNVNIEQNCCPADSIFFMRSIYSRNALLDAEHQIPLQTWCPGQTGWLSSRVLGLTTHSSLTRAPHPQSSSYPGLRNQPPPPPWRDYYITTLSLADQIINSF